MKFERFRTRENWLRARKTAIGASESATILGQGYANSSPLTVWDGKVNPTQDNGEEEPLRFWIGSEMEPVLRKIFEKVTGKPVLVPHAGYLTLYRDQEFNWLSATPDGLTDDASAVVELKDVGIHNRAEWEGDNVPLKYQIQVQHQLRVLDLQVGYLMALVGRDAVIRRVERNDDFLAAMLDVLRRFWAHVKNQTPPPIDGSAATTRALIRLHPDDSGEAVAIPEELGGMCAQLEHAKNEKKRIDLEIREAENQIRAAIGDASYGVTHDGRCYSWKTQTRKEFVVKASKTRVLRAVKALPKGLQLSDRV